MGWYRVGRGNSSTLSHTHTLKPAPPTPTPFRTLSTPAGTRAPGWYRVRLWAVPLPPILHPSSSILLREWQQATGGPDSLEKGREGDQGVVWV